MVYETSYESGRKPFAPDSTRGKWAHRNDFILAGIALAFRGDIFSTVWMHTAHMGILAVIPYLICSALFVVPIMVIQSFMGQFSSSGFISSLRLAPLFKGMGYLSLALNLTTLTYFSLFAAIPILYLVNSLRPTLPWSCDGMASFENVTETTICNITSLDEMDNSNETIYMQYHVPSVIYFGRLFSADFFETYDTEFTMSWPLVGCNIVAWSIVAFVLYRCFDTEKIGKIVRYGILTVMILLAICLTRIAFLPGASDGFSNFIWPGLHHFIEGIPIIPIYVISAFGAGWGSIISLASFNKFDTNIMRTSWMICVGQMLIYLAMVLTTFLFSHHFNEISHNDNENTTFHSYTVVNYYWILYLSSGSVLASMELPHMWCILYYSMLTIAALILLLIQAYSILTSVFDEFESLRAHKPAIALGMVLVLVISSLYSCSSDGITFLTALSMDVIFTQTLLNLLLLLVVLWIYGRLRFQRDIEFMLGQPFATWKVYMLRIISPFCLLFILFIAIVLAFVEHMVSTIFMIFAAISQIVIPWFFLPIYSVFILMQTTGTLRMRFKRTCRPTDWYPVEMDDRQHYEEAMGNTDLTYQLREVDDVPAEEDYEDPTLHAY